MSYIDTFDHELVGCIVGLPIYHPLERVENSGDVPTEFGTSPDQLVIGGGSGEHPAILLLDLPQAVSHLFNAALYYSNIVEPSFPEEIQFLLDQAIESQTLLAFPGWDVQTYANFYQRCTSKALFTPFNPDKFMSLESWLVASLGELLYFSMQEFWSNIHESIEILSKSIKLPLLRNVSILPPGFPEIGGRRTDSQQNITWGVSYWNK